jgi:hypothetical protein
MLVFVVLLLACRHEPTEPPRLDDPEFDAIDREGLPPQVGKWRPARPQAKQAGLTQQQAAEIKQLEALGYADGVREITPQTDISVHDPDKAQNGYNFVVSGHTAELELTDMNGELLHRWRHSFRDAFPMRLMTNANHFRRARLFDNGDVLGLFESGGVIRIDRNSRLKWAYPGKAHHDMQVVGDEVFVLSRKAHMLPRINLWSPTLEDFVSVLDLETGEVLREVSLLEAFENSEYDGIWRRKVHAKDIFHTNSIQVLDGRIADKVPAFAAGNVLISMRALSAIAVVDLSIPKVVWAHSGSYKKQHDAEILDNGNMLLFDNKGAKRRSRVIEYDVETMKPVWTYEGVPGHYLWSDLLGASQRLSGGNTLITESEGGRALEVTPQGEVVWEYYNPHRAGENDQYIASIFELIRVPTSAFPFEE